MHDRSVRTVQFERQLAGVACTAEAWAKVPETPSAEERRELKARIKRLLKERSAVLLAHYYVDPDIQDLAEETGGAVAQDRPGERRCGTASCRAAPLRAVPWSRTFGPAAYSAAGGPAVRLFENAVGWL